MSAEQARLKPWQRGLLDALGLDEQGYASAALCALGAGIDERTDWLHAEPIHLAAGMNEVTLVPLTADAAPTTAERNALTAVMQAHMTSAGLELRASAANEWLIGSKQPFKVQTVCAEYAMRNEWNAVLPQGEGAGQVRRLMTEIQMLLHEHSINEARSARGLPTVNALWLWGDGQIETMRRGATSRACFGDSDFLRGICKANGWEEPSQEQSVEAVVARAGKDSAVCVLSNISASEFERRWLSPVVAALKRGDLSRLELVLDEWHLTIDRWQLGKFWRRALPAENWARA